MTKQPGIDARTTYAAAAGSTVPASLRRAAS